MTGERERETETDSHVNRSIDRQKQNERGVEKARDWNRISCRGFSVEVSILVGGLGSIHVTVNPKDSNLSAANPEPQSPKCKSLNSPPRFYTPNYIRSKISWEKVFF